MVEVETDFRRYGATLAITIIGIIIALGWNDFVQQFIKTSIGDKDATWVKGLYALIITFILVFVIWAVISSTDWNNLENKRHSHKKRCPRRNGV